MESVIWVIWLSVWQWSFNCSVIFGCLLSVVFFVFFQAEDGIRDLVRSRGLGDVYKRQVLPEEGRMGDDAPEIAVSDHLAEFDAAREGAHRNLSLIHI